PAGAGAALRLLAESTVELAVSESCSPPPSKLTPPPSKFTPPPSKFTPPPSKLTPPPSKLTPPPSKLTPPPAESPNAFSRAEIWRKSRFCQSLNPGNGGSPTG